MKLNVVLISRNYKFEVNDHMCKTYDLALSAYSSQLFASKLGYINHLAFTMKGAHS